MRMLILLIVLAAAVSASGFAQSSLEIATDQATASISVFATDAHGNPVSAINEGDLSVEDEHKPAQRVVRVTRDVSPLRLGIVIDKSNSQGRSDLYWAGVQAINPFLKQVLRPDSDKVFIEVFDTVPSPPTAWVGADELGKLKLDVKPSGGSSLFDAIELVCKERWTDGPSPARRVLVVLTDGDDNQSRVTVDAASTAAQRAKVAILAINTHEENIYRQLTSSEVIGHRVLRRLAQDTGGYASLGLGPKDIPKVFSDIADKLNSMFQVVYIPARTAQNGERHQLLIKPVSEKKLHVQAAKEYYADTR